MFVGRNTLISQSKSSVLASYRVRGMAAEFDGASFGGSSCFF